MTTIVLAPFSNSDIRDWQPSHFAALIRDLLVHGRDDLMVRVIGTKSQKLRACDIVRDFDSSRVLNDCGRSSWPEVVEKVRSAACVIGNNSGIAHLAASFGVPTVCVFGGSHQRLEWRPLGFNVIVVTRSIACSPCHLDHGASCKYDKLCLDRIEPAVVARAARSLMSRPLETTSGVLQ